MRESSFLGEDDGVPAPSLTWRPRPKQAICRTNAAGFERVMVVAVHPPRRATKLTQHRHSLPIFLVW